MLSLLRVNVPVRGRDTEPTDFLKGDPRMVTFISRALRTRQHPLRDDVEIPVGRAIVVLKAQYTKEIVDGIDRTEQSLGGSAALWFSASRPQRD